MLMVFNPVASATPMAPDGLGLAADTPPKDAQVPMQMTADALAA